MQELSNLSRNRYLIRNAKSRENLAIIEATSTAHAIRRAAQLAEVTTLLQQDIEFEAMKIDTPKALPTFLNGYFDFLSKQVN